SLFGTRQESDREAARYGWPRGSCDSSGPPLSAPPLPPRNPPPAPAIVAQGQRDARHVPAPTIFRPLCSPGFPENRRASSPPAAPAYRAGAPAGWGTALREKKDRIVARTRPSLRSWDRGVEEVSEN